jgi:3-hydroxybutyryl-CoA dehydrogenase
VAAEALPVEAETVAVIGAGGVGRRLALRALRAGFRVVLEDLIPGSLSEAREQLAASLQKLVSAGSMSAPQAEEALGRISIASTIEGAARQSRIVMETGPDEFESKLEMFCLLDRICLPNTLIVSNCHTLELSDTAARADSIVGMYFDGDAAEVHCSAFTSETTLAAACKLAEKLATSYTVTRDGQA